MAIYHLSVKTISRSAGRSVTAAAAYRASEKIVDARTGEIHDYTHKKGVLSTDIILPTGAPAWAKEREALWNAAEQSETRKNSTVGREFEIALPDELNESQRRQLAIALAQEIVARHNCVADVAIHEPGKGGDNRNHHAHVLCSTRRIALRRFITWCAERDLSEPPDITKPIIERYQKHLFYYRKPDGTPMTLGSQLQNLAPLKTWFKWLARENHILSNPASELQLPKQPKHLPRTILSAQEVEAILAEAAPNNAQGIRDRAMLEVLYSTGLRRMEIVGLACYDVDLNRQLVFVREGKGRRDRVVPIGARAAAWVDKYLIEARPQLLAADTVALFVTDYGEAISPEMVATKVKRYMEFAGINKPGATHLLRHACATHMLEGGADIRFIQAMLGHSSLETTEIYTHVSIDKLKEIHAATHPARLERRQDPNGAPAGASADDARQALLDAIDDE